MKTRTKTRLTFVAVLLVAVLAGLASWPKGPDINVQIGSLDWQQELKVRLGLDLRGGTHLVYQAQFDEGLDPADYEEAIQGTRDVLERRINASELGLGVSEPLVQTNQVGDDYRVIVELPGVDDVSEAIRIIGETPSLDFRRPIVDNPFVPQEDLTSQFTVEGEGDDARLVDVDGNPLSEEQLDELAAQLEAQQTGLSGIAANFERTDLTGARLERATLQFDQTTQEAVVLLEFDEQGRELFAQMTRDYLGQPFAIFLDDVLISAPIIQSEIVSGEAQISGNFTVEEARELARNLSTGALPVKIELLTQTNVGASLGEASVEASFLAGVIGLLLVAIFMILYYRWPGVLAVLALVIYAMVSLSIFKLLGVTMTLAGVAGFILSIGLAVDANVLIFEHMREELRKGHTLKRSVEDGFTNAWVAIRDSNVSTLITAFLLSIIGTSLIQGFAVTLAIGVLVSMFTAITVTRTFLRLVIGKGDQTGGFWYGARPSNKAKQN
ncbi:MAG: protein translocase subunit SecD [Candidatus Andersenbacteria bacterium]|nr:protein translocase subunit SecD [Candidatus Andersenbacteria bacterium]